ncbi:hypothetical protein DPMN_083272 [Dreissena polymorpha]|uniref:Uncharacterized protein n=1 Tax=Dreissena polymorpha TaxID=45954 RepID=A0A9D4BJN1_DREPO|nr:hypothetical protein DPMN_083272 [Dreissena polymorpha]
MMVPVQNKNYHRDRIHDQTEKVADKTLNHFNQSSTGSSRPMKSPFWCAATRPWHVSRTENAGCMHLNIGVYDNCCASPT